MEFKPVVIEKARRALRRVLLGPLRRRRPATPRRWRRSGRAGASNPEDLRRPARPHLEGAAGAGRAARRREWHDIVDWVDLRALIEAEEKGHHPEERLDEMAKSEAPDIKRMLGATPGMGKALGLDEKWAYNAIKAVGNYGEIFDRHLGLNTPLKLERGYNNLWTKGGLIYAPPIR